MVVVDGGRHEGVALDIQRCTGRYTDRLVEQSASGLSDAQIGVGNAKDCYAVGGVSMTAHRQRGRVVMIRSALSQRDLAILGDVRRVRLLSARQVERLHFADGTPGSRARRSRRVLRRLHDSGLLVRLQRRVGGVHAGSSGHIYALSSLGQRVIDAPGPAGGSRRRRPWEPSAHFVDHILDVSETYVRLREAERNDHFEIVRFEAEPACWRTVHQFGGDSFVLKPDAFVVLGIGAFEQVSFIEVDRGTEHTPTLRRKLAAYVAAYHAGVEQTDGAAFPQVVWIVPDNDRANQLEQIAARLPPQHGDLFVTTTNNPQQQLTTLKGGES